MSVTSGFFNSVGHDRGYNSEQMSEIFDGVINDGVFMNIGSMLTVLATTGNTITVGTGKCWFNSTWIKNDAILPLVAEQSEVLLDRIDTVIVEVDHTIEVRNCFIKVIKGTPSSNPEKPTLTRTQYVNQYPLAFIKRIAGSTSITQANITNAIGTKDCPYVTGILKTADIDHLINQWSNEWQHWTDEQKILFQEWTDQLKNVLQNDVATSLAQQIYQTNSVTLVTLKASDWLGSNVPYYQTVPIANADVTAEATLVSALEDGASLDTQLAYKKAFTIVSSGTASLGKDAYQPVYFERSVAWESGSYSETTGEEIESNNQIRFDGPIELTSLKTQIKMTWFDESWNLKIFAYIYDSNLQFTRKIGPIISGTIIETSATEKYCKLVIADESSLIGNSTLISAFDLGNLTVSVGYAIGSGTFKVYKKPLTDITVGLKGIGGNAFEQNTPIILDATGNIIISD